MHVGGLTALPDVDADPSGRVEAAYA